MEIPKDKVLELLRERGDHDKAEQADQASTEDEVEDAFVHDALERAVAKLPEQERTVIQMRFGRNREGRVHTHQQAGRALGLSASRARELEEAALRRLAANGDLDSLREAA